MLGLFHLMGVLCVGLTRVQATTLSDNDPVVVGITFLARSMDPTDGSAGWALTSHGVAEKLFTVNKHDEIVGQVAESARKVSELVWDVTLKPNYKFSDGTPVDAQHVAACLTALNEKNSSAQSSLGKMTMTAEDELTVRITSERPTHVMDAVLAEWVFAMFRQDTDGNFIFTGPYVIENFADDHIDLAPNRYYPDSMNRPQIDLKEYGNGDDLAEALKNNEVDLAFHLPIHTLPDLRSTDGVRIKSFEVGYQYMAFYNLDSLTDVRVRSAIDLAIDRLALSQALAGGHGTRSLFPDYSPYYVDDGDSHGDPTAAAALLDEAGWLLNATTGQREKDGQALTVRLITYPHRPGLGIMMPVIARSLEELGIATTSMVTGSEWSEMTQNLNERTFDILLWAQHTLPAGDPLWFLSAFFRSDGGNNHSGLRSDTVDAMLDGLSTAEDHAVRVQMTADTMKAILDTKAVSSLVTPDWHIGVSERLAEYEPWGSDYYVIRPDLMIAGASGPLIDETSVEEDTPKQQEEDTPKQQEQLSDETSMEDTPKQQEQLSESSSIRTASHSMVVSLTLWALSFVF